MAPAASLTSGGAVTEQFWVDKARERVNIFEGNVDAVYSIGILGKVPRLRSNLNMSDPGC